MSDMTLADSGVDGGNRVVSDEVLGALKEELNRLGGAEQSFWSGHDQEDAVRLQVWRGQSADGRKWEENSEEEVRPFNGCADHRVFVVEFILRAKVALAIEAITRASIAVMPMTSHDAELAGRCEVLLKWMSKNLWRSRGRRQAKLFVNWFCNDGFSALHSFYERKLGVRNEAVSLESIIGMYLDMLPEDEVGGMLDEREALENAIRELFLGAGVDEDKAAKKQRDEDAVDVLRAAYPDLPGGRLNKMLRQIRREGLTLAPVTLAGREGPRPTALRVGEDLFFDEECGDIQDAPFLFVVERLSEAQVRSRAELEGWNDAFVDELVPKDGAGQRGMMTVFQDAARFAVMGADDERIEVITALRKAVDGMGRTGVYRVVFHANVEVAGTDDELLEDAYGDYPLVVQSREVLSNKLLDSRGWPEMAGPGQSLIKWLLDLATNVTALKTLPPIRAPQNRKESELLLAPLAVIRERRPGEVQPFTGFEYPREALDVAAKIEEALLGLAALPVEGVKSQVTELLQLDEVKDLMAGMEDFYGIALTQLLHNMSRERLEEIAGGPLGDLSPEALSWRVNISLSFDPRHLDREFVKDWLQTMGSLVLPMDTQSVILRDALVRLSVRMMEPGMAEDLTRDADEAQESEIEKEEQEIARIVAGFAPNLLEFDDGADFRARMEVLQQWLEENAQPTEDGEPGLLSTLPMRIQERLLEHKENLTQQLTQMDNVQVGRTGVQSVG